MKSGKETAWRHLPNFISLVRIALVLPVAVLITREHYSMALWLALAAGLSDAFDGWLARHFGWRSRLGALLDPAADKLLLMTCYLVLALMQVLPLWLALLVLGRDLVILGGALGYRLWIGPFKAQPRRLAKLSTMLQILFVLLVLLRNSAFASMQVQPLGWLVAVLTVASGVDYVIHWLARARRQRVAFRPCSRSVPHDA
ncbi:CDP-alcohol phosphatidyltransferase family protein [Oleiagrimonas sp.]|jgi:cardiolipin synthase|uniref:CDP-alcohol phosphatidyltransferase family protein n=1 Tax=Oleiagrimonas sp. TaxID=2010330 RepID=UPI0026376FBE|nr:CDP-alcohol phosphatidyltransferase family protein [Oleiagrimonas sp.]MDA3914048.1 CDP-alcohol phosphatidyltransferase family protein [Oleiagrimonas sp.]